MTRRNFFLSLSGSLALLAISPMNPLSFAGGLNTTTLSIDDVKELLYAHKSDQLKKQIQSDFESGSVIEVDGWILSKTELELSKKND